jgi:putative membrane protein
MPTEMPLTPKLLPQDSFNRLVLATFLVLWAFSCIRVPYPEFFVMQHVPTVLAVIALIVAERKQLLNRLGFALVILFLLLHLLGARYLYSFVPYDVWSQQLLGVRITDRFGFTRNHYDRLVHFSFGLLFVYPVAYCFKQRLHINSWWSATLAIAMIVAASALYEIAEWLTAMTCAPDWADAYNGQQGDTWDAQRDMAIATLGGIISFAIVVPFLAYSVLIPQAPRHSIAEE